MKKIITSLALSLALIAGAFGQSSYSLVPKDTYYPSGNLQTEFKKVASTSIKVTYYYEDGTVRETGFFRNGRNHGKWVAYSTDGQKMAEGLFHQSRRNGVWRYWDQEGDLQCTLVYAKDRVQHNACQP